MRVAASRGAIRRKNLNIDQRKIERARRILGTETETVDRALDLVVFRNEILRSLERVKGKGGVEPLDAVRGLRPRRVHGLDRLSGDPPDRGG